MDNFNNEFNNSTEPTVDYSQPGTFTGATAQWQSNNAQEELPTYTESFDNAYSYEAPVYERDAKENNGKIAVSIISMILGIISLVCCPVYLSYITIVFAFVALIMGFISVKNKYAGKGMAIAGIICGAIGFIISGIVLAMIMIACVGGVASSASSSYYYY